MPLSAAGNVHALAIFYEVDARQVSDDDTGMQSLNPCRRTHTAGQLVARLLLRSLSVPPPSVIERHAAPLSPVAAEDPVA